MRLRSLLFVPGDRPERFAKAAASGADAIILDLEDSVSPANKEAARAAIADYLAGTREVVTLVRVNPLDGHMTAADVAAIVAARPDAIMLPKAEGAPSIAQLDTILRSESDRDASLPPILPIATETPAAIFTLGSYREVKDRLLGLTWGAEDLPAAIGATTSREADGSYTAPYEVARAMTLFAAHAAGAAAIDTVFPAIKDEAGLAAYATRARRDGFTGMMAIHPSQVEPINAAFTPSADEAARAQAIVDAFAANPGAGVLQVDGKMVDAPHLKQAKHILSLAD
ncbi:citrate lyase subunit beta / citryl-CoA lyase [Sphingopyxis sp. YR583]|jgi:citrate lyase subunit beta/citryl-CoA lyase|uniref:HpcH/HpaI aldolase/citrate lyase family protein n=1 Tax=Sphingopyxis sp. YR583 TaxID=1881047 RepID=UPI0008A75D14|nr:CoA ester lyase [Sphingopyxis sp. YR583]SEH18588.1 citrate lyase subunit beta / citryl-CoA lyase [Sphingopyxis sp. YR583]